MDKKLIAVPVVIIIVAIVAAGAFMMTSDPGDKYEVRMDLTVGDYYEYTMKESAMGENSLEKIRYEITEIKNGKYTFTKTVDGILKKETKGGSLEDFLDPILGSEAEIDPSSKKTESCSVPFGNVRADRYSADVAGVTGNVWCVEGTFIAVKLKATGSFLGISASSHLELTDASFIEKV